MEANKSKSYPNYASFTMALYEENFPNASALEVALTARIGLRYPSESFFCFHSYSENLPSSLSLFQIALMIIYG